MIDICQKHALHKDRNYYMSNTLSFAKLAYDIEPQYFFRSMGTHIHGPKQGKVLLFCNAVLPCSQAIVTIYVMTCTTAIEELCVCMLPFNINSLFRILTDIIGLFLFFEYSK